MGTKVISLRLTADDLAALRKMVGDTDAERVRNLIHNAAISAGLAHQIAAEVAVQIVGQIDKNASPLHAETQRLVRALGPILNQMYQNLLTQLKQR